MALVRRARGFHRYVFSVCYDGSNFLGFSYQGRDGENCISRNGTDLRGIQSVEGRIRSALSSLVDDGCWNNRFDRLNGSDYFPDALNYENFQVSSRTDRGVHALHNTFHVDIRHRDMKLLWDPRNLIKGLNFYLVKSESAQLHTKKPFHKSNLRHSSKDAIRITSANYAPQELVPNKHFSLDDTNEINQPSHISWNARFTATSRTYLYRIIFHPDDDSKFEEIYHPFEVGRSWRIRGKSSLNLHEMEAAANFLTGTHDFTSFRGKRCHRRNAITTIYNIDFSVVPFLSSFTNNHMDLEQDKGAQLMIITIKGSSFLYHQVRNIIGCLIEVGLGKIQAQDVNTILETKDRSIAPPTSPSCGLYLAQVEHYPPIYESF